MVYTPNRFAGASPDGPQSATIVVRTATEPSGAAPAVRAVVRKMDPDVPIVALRPMSLLVAQSVSARRFQMSLALLFALSALLLASMGIFGVVAYSVEQRRHELGIRKALGAADVQLRNMVLRQGMMPVFLGLAAGIAAALYLGRLIGSLLFGVDPFDPLITAGVVFVIVGVSLAGCWIPARRATHIDPMVALRYE
jgi:putative ABC transport system permease protein